ncbi:MAG: hypothetical protein J7513_09330 [Solirubrobacteraceae bacterium]|nr:hypothetical protein [Solirubrobacteraceae bacterium]
MPIPLLPTAPIVPRDHSLSLHRFVGGVQLLGGLTLGSAYALGAETARIDGAAAALVVIGIIQFAAGLLWLARPSRFRQLVTTRPGAVVAATAIPAVTVAALGGSSADTSWVTSTECWLIAAGAVLRLRGIAAIVVVGTIVAGVVWQLADGDAGGYRGDGAYLVATIALAKVLGVGLWIGRVTGATWRLLSRWFVIERNERGIVERLRAQLLRIDAAAAAVGARLERVPEAVQELRVLRARLARGLDMRIDGAPVMLGTLLADLAAEHEDAEPITPLVLELPDDATTVALAPGQAAALVAAIRRQLGNVVRHAPSATRITLSASRAGDALRLCIEDDGGGAAPVDPGTGSAWSGRQIGRFGGTMAYYDGTAGVGLELRVPLTPVAHMRAPELSLDFGMDRFAGGALAALRWAGYIGDTLAATGVEGIGSAWLWMPIGAAVIEYVIWRGVPGLRLSDDHRRILASFLAIALAAGYAVPPGSPTELVPATTSVVVVATLLLNKQHLAWLTFEFARALAVLPLVLRTGESVVELVVIYPIAFNLLVYLLRRFIDQARGLEGSTLDASGRAALSSATLHGLALRHDVVDVLLRTGPADPELEREGAELEDAVDELRSLAAASLDPRAVVQTGLEAALGMAVVTDGPGWSAPAGATAGAGAVDRVTLSEIAALAADERASCAPQGLFGRRRLRGIAMRWERGNDGATILTLTAEPTLAPPDPAAVDALERIASTVGVRVQSLPAELRLAYVPSSV